MTSYQNVAESEIAGYNDCPVLDPAASSHHLKPRRPRPHAHNLSSTSLLSSASNNSSCTSLSSMPPAPPSRKPSGQFPPPLSKPPTMKRLPSTSTVSRTEAATTTAVGEISDETVTESVDELTSLPSTLPLREFEHYSKKLREAIPKIQQKHRALVLGWMKNYSNKDEVKDAVVKFMMVNDGTSGWAQPLRKLLEGVKE